MRHIPRVRRLRSRILEVAGTLSLAACFNLGDVNQGLSVLAIVGGNNQTIAVGSTDAQPLSVRALDAGAVAIEGVRVSWTVSSGGGSVSDVTLLTDAQGLASVTYRPGTSTGPVVVKATAEGLTVTFNLTVVAAGTT
ncbi:MAG: hypothetical protein ABI681_02545 [Gemmatimonadales bacterium]